MWICLKYCIRETWWCIPVLLLFTFMVVWKFWFSFHSTVHITRASVGYHSCLVDTCPTFSLLSLHFLPLSLRIYQLIMASMPTKNSPVFQIPYIFISFFLFNVMLLHSLNPLPHHLNSLHCDSILQVNLNVLYTLHFSTWSMAGNISYYYCVYMCIGCMFYSRVSVWNWGVIYMQKNLLSFAKCWEGWNMPLHNTPNSVYKHWKLCC
jgi:hypothetical protein